MKPINELPLLRQYDKLIAVIVLIGLVVSLFYLTNAGLSRKKAEAEFFGKITRLQPTGKPLDPISLQTYTDAANTVRKPPALNVPDNNKAGCLTPEHRVLCIEEGCRKPIPYASEKCPFCGEEQPRTPENPPPGMDSDGDGIPDEIEVKYGLNKNVAADAQLDMDGDGFSNLAEYKEGTDMSDPASHPSLMSLLRLKSIQSLKIPFIFTALNKMPTGELQMTFNVAKPRPRTYWVTEGEAIGDTGWVALKAERKSARQKNEAKGYVQTIDISTVVVKRKSDNKEVTLTINEGRKDTDVEATIVLPLDQTEYQAIAGGTFKIREETYRVVSVDKDAESVTVENESNGKQKIVTKLD
ncbi:MAG: Amuc_1099 family pilus-like system protein [Kiritimatiellia bacterium]